MATPSTPKRKRVASNAADDGSPSPRKTRAPRGTPTKAEERKAAATAKAEAKAKRNAAWKLWCSQNVWQPDPASPYRQKIGNVEMHRTEAMNDYRFIKEEMATLPYITFENKNHPKAPAGKSYVVAMLDKLAHRKFAALNTDGPPPEANSPAEAAFLEDGKKLFEDRIAKLKQRSKSPRKKPKKWTIVPKLPQIDYDPGSYSDEYYSDSEY
ncbi:hypothetical protein C8R46DRAFT_1064036 [Mycena filopes]|nr:hypothetical protein C8R46DRAFT_1064036 [Mycena filopes]